MLPDALWRDVRREAEREGISASQYIREAVIAAVYFERGQRGDKGPMRQRR